MEVGGQQIRIATVLGTTIPDTEDYKLGLRAAGEPIGENAIHGTYAKSMVESL